MNTVIESGVVETAVGADAISAETEVCQEAEQIGLIGLCIQFLEIGRAGGKPVESLNTSKMGGVSRADDVFWGCKYSG